MKKLAIFLLVLLAPLGGVVYGLHRYTAPKITFPQEQTVLSIVQLTKDIDRLLEDSLSAYSNTDYFHVWLDKQRSELDAQQRLVVQLVAESKSQKNLFMSMYEKLLIVRLGKSIDRYASENVEIALYQVNENGYRSTLAKVRLKNPDNIKVRLARNTYGEVETTSEAVNSENAVLGVNGGGFYSTVKKGKTIYVSVGNTVVDGELLNKFVPSANDIFFCGFNAAGKLVGGNFSTESSLMALAPRNGASFLPAIMKNSRSLAIPKSWRQTRQPRTIVGYFANGDIFFWVIDGRQNGWSKGATLEQVQAKLQTLGAVDAYNLDGGGSSTMVFKGKLINRPSDGHERPITTNFLIMP